MFFDNYLKKRSISFNDHAFPDMKEEKYFSSIIVIPSYKESEYLFKTLKSINDQLKVDLQDLLVIVVVNNGYNDPSSIINDNIKTIKLIENFNSCFNLNYIDAATGSNSLSDNLAGVGYARKIGMDFALKYSKENTILHCLDADTIVAPDYLLKIQDTYSSNNLKALIVDFKHQGSNDIKLNRYIKEYELFLKKTAADIKQSGSPYGYVSLGPTITCLAETYVRVGGMVNKKATEDFYFLQKIRKFCEIYFLNEELVFPSSRLSDRVYLGTGFRMLDSLNGKLINDLYYSEKSFRILTETIALLLSSYGKDSESIAKGLLSIDSTLHEFFLKEGLFSVWDKINKESKIERQFELQFHKWFDNLKTLRLLKFYS